MYGYPADATVVTKGCCEFFGVIGTFWVLQGDRLLVGTPISVDTDMVGDTRGKAVEGKVGMIADSMEWINGMRRCYVDCQ